MVKDIAEFCFADLLVKRAYHQVNAVRFGDRSIFGGWNFSGRASIHSRNLAQFAEPIKDDPDLC